MKLQLREGQTQTLFADPASDVPGNCLQAAVATYFGMRLDLVPHFVLFQDWAAALTMWLDQYGAHLTWVRTPTLTIPDELCLVLGRSPRDVPHICVADHGAITWDPHPSRAGLSSVSEAWFFVKSNAGVAGRTQNKAATG